jgi:hypothetical protein
MALHDSEKTHHDFEKQPASPASLKEDIHRDGFGRDEYECEFSPAEQRKIVHRIDRRLVLTVGVLYCISLMDRTNLSAAAIAGSVAGTLPCKERC